MNTTAQVRDVLMRVRQTIDHSRMIQERSRIMLEAMTAVRIIRGTKQLAFPPSRRQSSVGEN